MRCDTDGAIGRSDLKLSATVEQIAEVKQIRRRVLRNSPYLRNLQRDDEDAWREELKLQTPDSVSLDVPLR